MGTLVKEDNYITYFDEDVKVYESELDEFYFLEKPDNRNLEEGLILEKEIKYVIDVSEYDGFMMHGDNFLIKNKDYYIYFGEKVIEMKIENYESFTRIDSVYYIVSDKYYYDICDGKRYKREGNVRAVKRGKFLYIDFLNIFEGGENFDTNILYTS